MRMSHSLFRLLRCFGSLLVLLGFVQEAVRQDEYRGAIDPVPGHGPDYTSGTCAAERHAVLATVPD